MASGDRAREERLAKNETLFRDLNERIEQAAGRETEGGDKYGFVCECSHDDCFELVHMTIVEYERLRGNPLRFVVIAGHEIPEIEEVVERQPGYYFVKKTGSEQKIAADTDPRK